MGCGGRKLSREDRTWSGHRNYVETWGLARLRVSPAPKGHRGRPWEQKGPWAEEAQRSQGKGWGSSRSHPLDPPFPSRWGQGFVLYPPASGKPPRALSRALKKINHSGELLMSDSLFYKLFIIMLMASTADFQPPAVENSLLFTK